MGGRRRDRRPPDAACRPRRHRPVVDNLEELARYRQALAIENPDPLSRLRGRFTLDIERLGPDRKTWSVAAPAPECGHIVFDEGDIVRFVVRSTLDARVFISLHDFGLSGRVQQVYPAKGAQELLRPSGEIVGRPQRLGFPEGDASVDSPDRARGEAGVETLKLFVTAQPADFSVLDQGGFRSGASPLAVLLTETFQGAPTRDTAPVSVGEEDWTTVTRSFVLRRKAGAAAAAGRA